MTPRSLSSWLLAIAALFTAAVPALAETGADIKMLVVPVNRSTLVTLPMPMAQVIVANPDIADVYAHDASNMTIVARRLGSTTVRAMDKDSKLVREFDVMVSYDLPAIRKALKNFLPDEAIGVEMVNTSVALTGHISSASTADKAVRIVSDFIQQDAARSGDGTLSNPEILNLMQVISGQQVMLRVRVGEINRDALKNLGFDTNVVTHMAGTGLVGIGTGTGVGAGVAGITGVTSPNPGVFVLPANSAATPLPQGVVTGRWQPGGPGDNTVAGLLKALEQDGLFKLLAEPNLVAVSGEEAEFLAGGEIPIPVVQGTASVNNNVTIEYKPFGVAVRFTPQVLSENRVRIAVQPEVSEVTTDNSVMVSGFSIPSISTRRARTTVELAPGESFMIAGLIKDQMRATINQVPGAKELPILGALLRSSEFQRNETELVIAVTPYVVDPLKSSDIKLPTDNFQPASQMEMFFLGHLSGLTGAPKALQAPGVEGPIGFMVD